MSEGFLDALQSAGPAPERAHRLALAADIERFIERPLEPVPMPRAAPAPPPGQPIGMPDMYWLMCEW